MLVEYFSLKPKQKSRKLNCACRIEAVGRSPTLDNRIVLLHPLLIIDVV